MMRCDEVQNFINDYVFDNASLFVRAQISEHLRSCPKCKEEYELLCEMRDTLQSMPRLEADAAFQSGLDEKLDQLAREVPAKKRSFLRVRRRWKPVRRN